MPATKLPADFTNVKEGGVFRPRRKPEGDYVAKVVKVDDHKFKDTTKSGWVFTIMVKGDQRSTYPVYCSTSENELWKIRKMFQASGIAVPKKRVMVDPNKLLNKTIGITLEDDEYEGRLKSSIADFLPANEVTSPDDEDDTDTGTDDEEVEDEEVDTTPPPPRKRAAKKAAPAPESEDDEDDDEPEPTPPPRKRTRKAAPPPPTEDDDDDDLELEEL